jgi:hypothetical protein
MIETAIKCKRAKAKGLREGEREREREREKALIRHIFFMAYIKISKEV